MEWMPIEEFPEYSVDARGRIMRNTTGRILTLTRNPQGVVQVGLTQNGQQYKRGVARLVAQAFLPSAIPYFDTPIHLDGDLTNNNAYNLMWRPRWFATQYQRQFKRGDKIWIDRTIIDKKTQVHYRNSWHAATTCGLLDKEIFLAIQNRTYVWPTYQEFKVMEESKH